MTSSADGFIPAGAGNTRLTRSGVDAPSDRFIPAGAGNTSHKVRAPTRAIPVHPRGRGEHGHSATSSTDHLAVHPRGRGEHGEQIEASPRSHDGSSPRAGNTRGCRAVGVVRWVHPRGRGEHPASWLALSRLSGSSPRARGTRGGGREADCRTAVHPRGRGEHRARVPSPRAASRFIPGAGEHQEPPCGMLPLVHPRGRGEHWPWVMSVLCPRRFIPAGAGNTCAAGTGHRRGFGSSPRARGALPAAHTRPWPQAVHPRGRGEHWTIVTSAMSRPPVHPRGRGEHDQVLTHGARASRFIPAGAGNTSPEEPTAQFHWVDPRGRGDTRDPFPAGGQ